jgi:hypothetical protein
VVYRLPGFYWARRYPDLEPGEARELAPVVLEAFPRPKKADAPRVRVLGPRRARVSADGKLSDLGIDTRQARCRGPRVPTRTATISVDNDFGFKMVVMGLKPGQRYRCSARAHNVSGWAPWSESSDWFRTPPRGGGRERQTPS